MAGPAERAADARSRDRGGAGARRCRLQRPGRACPGVQYLRLFPTTRCRCHARSLYISAGRGRLIRSVRPSVIPGRSRGSVVVDRTSAARVSADFRPRGGPPAPDNDVDPPTRSKPNFDLVEPAGPLTVLIVVP